MPEKDKEEGAKVGTESFQIMMQFWYLCKVGEKEGLGRNLGPWCSTKTTWANAKCLPQYCVVEKFSIEQRWPSSSTLTILHHWLGVAQGECGWHDPYSDPQACQLEVIVNQSYYLSKFSWGEIWARTTIWPFSILFLSFQTSAVRDICCFCHSPFISPSFWSWGLIFPGETTTTV